MLITLLPMAIVLIDIILENTFSMKKVVLPFTRVNVTWFTESAFGTPGHAAFSMFLFIL